MAADLICMTLHNIVHKGNDSYNHHIFLDRESTVILTFDAGYK